MRILKDSLGSISHVLNMHLIIYSYILVVKMVASSAKEMAGDKVER